MKGLTRRSSRFYLALSIAAASLAALSLLLYLRGLSTRIAEGGRLITLVVAARDMVAGEVVDPSSLRLADFPENYLFPGAFTDPGEVIGSSLRGAVSEGEPLLASSLLSPGEHGLARSSLGRDFRAYPLPATAVAFPAVELREGSHVDILALTGDVAVLLLENVEVICVYGGRVFAMQESAELSSASSPCIILKLTPEEACRLAAARGRGEVEIMLRPD